MPYTNQGVVWVLALNSHFSPTSLYIFYKNIAWTKKLVKILFFLKSQLRNSDMRANWKLVASKGLDERLFAKMLVIYHIHEQSNQRKFSFCIVWALLVVAVSPSSNHVVILNKMRDKPLFCLLKRATRNKHQEHTIMFAHSHTVQAYTKLIVRFVLVDVI